MAIEIKVFKMFLNNECFHELSEMSTFNYRALTLYPQLLQRINICGDWFENVNNYYELNFEE